MAINSSIYIAFLVKIITPVPQVYKQQRYTFVIVIVYEVADNRKPDAIKRVGASWELSRGPHAWLNGWSWNHYLEGFFRASIGANEALELRDGDNTKCDEDVLTAVDNVNKIIAPTLVKASVDVKEVWKSFWSLWTALTTSLSLLLMPDISLADARAPAEIGIEFYKHITIYISSTDAKRFERWFPLRWSFGGPRSHGGYIGSDKFSDAFQAGMKFTKSWRVCSRRDTIPLLVLLQAFNLLKKFWIWI